MKNAPALHLIEYVLFRAVRGLITALPHNSSRTLGARLGDLGRLVLGGRRRVAEENLAAAFPDRDRAEIKRLTRDCFRHFGASLTETLSIRRFSATELCGRLSYEGWEHLEAGAARPEGCFLMSAHLGYWEIASYPPGLYVRPFHVVGRPLDNPHLDRELAEGRKLFGNAVIPKRGAVRGMLKALKAGHLVGILIDQRVPKEQGILVDFFGRPSRTTPILARLSISTGAPVVPIYAVPEPGGRYRVIFREPIEPEGEGDEAIAALTRRYLEAVENEIRNQPELWLWMHERWKRQ